MLDKTTVLTTMFTRVDDAMKGSAVIQQAVKRPGPAPHLTDSEVITIALYQELIGEPQWYFPAVVSTNLCLQNQCKRCKTLNCE